MVLLEKRTELPLVQHDPLWTLAPTHFVLPDDEHELPSLDSGRTSTAPSIVEALRDDAQLEQGEGEDDTVLWTLPDVVSERQRNDLLSWDTFLRPEKKEIRSVYLSETGTKGWDVALQIARAAEQQLLPEKEVSQHLLVSCLFELGLGRDSPLFMWNEGKTVFANTIENFMLSGFSVDIIQDVVASVGKHGVLVQQIKQVLARPKERSLSTGIALASAMHSVLFHFEQRVERQRLPVQTVLQTSTVFQKTTPLLVQLLGLTQALQGDEEDGLFVSRALEFVERNSNEDAWVNDILEEVVRRASNPWLTTILENCGVKSGGFQSIDSGDAAEDAITKPMTPETMEIYTDCRDGLQLLRASESSHPLLSDRPSLGNVRWEIGWQAIQRVEAKARALQEQLQTLVDKSKDANRSFSPPTTVAEHGEAGVTVPFLDSIPTDLEDFLTAGLLASFIEPDAMPTLDPLSQLIESDLDDLAVFPTIKPALSYSLDMTLSPLLTIQNRVVQRACLRLLLEKNDLRPHLLLLKQYQLLGNGDFTSRLCSALFDPNLSSGERKSARTRTTYSTGLRLETRNTWPPATSELRLVLMGILAESYKSSSLANTFRYRNMDAVSEELPGDMSFSIRELSDAELDLIRDAHNIEALDFLCVSYRPNTALQSIITERSLQKYDRVFKHLLRLTRVHQATQSMIRDINRRDLISSGTSSISSTSNHRNNNNNNKLRIEMHRFISGLYQYSMNMAVGQSWHAFDLYLQEIEQSLQKEEDISDLGGNSVFNYTLSSIRETHEKTLDTILNSMYLSKKFHQIKELLDNLMRAVLEFFARLRHRHENDHHHHHHDRFCQHDDNNNHQQEREEEDFRNRFKKLATKLCVFLKSQSSASSSSSFSSSTRTTTNSNNKDRIIHEINEREMAEQLLLHVDFTGYYCQLS